MSDATTARAERVPGSMMIATFGLRLRQVRNWAVALLLVGLGLSLLTWPTAEQQRQRVALELASLPAPSGSVLAFTESGSKPLSAIAIRYFASDALSDDITAFYRATLQRSDWIVQSESLLNGTQGVCFHRDDLSASVEVAPIASPTWFRFSVTMSWGFPRCGT